MKEKDRDEEKKTDNKKRKAEDDSGEKSKLKPVRPKIGEHKDNLKQRSNWFQKRSGKRS